MSTSRLWRLPQLARLLTVTLTLLLTIGLFAPSGRAATPTLPSAPAPAPAGRTEAPMPGPATAAPPTGEGEAARDDAPASEHPAPVQLTPEQSQPAKAATAKGLGAAAADTEAAACNGADFANRTGAALVQLVRFVDFWCVNGLFVLPAAEGRRAFAEPQMTAVANAAREAAAAYRGDNSGQIVQLLYYLQAGFFWQSTHTTELPGYGTAVRAAVRSAAETFFANPRSRDVTAANADPLARAAVLLDCLRESTRYLGIVKELLNSYDVATWGKQGLTWSVNPVFTLLFTGHTQAGFVDAVRADKGVLDALYGFTLRNQALLGGPDRRVLWHSVNELGRFVAYPDLRPRLQPMLRTLLDRSSVTGDTRYQRAAVVASIRYADPEHCGYWGTCEEPERLGAANLTVSFTCSPSIRIRAQAATTAQLTAACASLTAQDAFFHRIARDKGPVAGDLNSRIEVVVFGDSWEYTTLAAAIFGIATDNGGMYLEGDPAKAGNQARFVAYEAEWLDGFQVWNLNHEYTHYLDARFTMHGTFEEGSTTPTVWWTEGFAEYLAVSYLKEANEAAMRLAREPHAYRLSELFDTTYANGNQDRTYRWGYLAVRYMMEQRRGDTDTVLARYRAGDWQGARSFLKDTIGTRLDADFDQWLYRCGAGACATVPTGPVLPECGGDTRRLGPDCARNNVSAGTGNHAHFYVLVPPGTKQLRVTASGGTGNGDLRYNPYGWAYENSYVTASAGPDNAETLTVTDPPAGYVYFSLQAKQGFSGVTVTAAY
ncbi:collagenase [Kitasatospora sp. NPDC096147]|uniref:M9 family metallopeptidase n=1 Tax=Kitasatospora sp. NPDC096147 TaxID=3364093 RepID=UPI00382F1606